MNVKAVRLHILALALISILFIQVVGLFTAKVFAADYPKLNNRSLLIDNVTPGAVTAYSLSWRYPAPTSIGSIRLLLCTDPVIENPCTNPGGDLSAASLVDQSGITGFSIGSQSANEILLTRTPGAASTVQSTYVLDSVINPMGLQRKLFIRIQTYASNNGTGTFNHASSVANATTEPIVINTEVPPILYFCAALTIDPWCANSSGDFIDYDALDPINGHSATSQFGVATNATGGYVVTVNGNTMTSGNKTIEANAIPSAYTTGTAQFGINLRANTVPALGQDALGEGIGTVSGDYDTPDLFKYVDGDVVASAVTGSLFNTFTATYILNIPPDQPSGVYNTTIAYICTAAF